MHLSARGGASAQTIPVVGVLLASPPTQVMGVRASGAAASVAVEGLIGWRIGPGAPVQG